MLDARSSVSFVFAAKERLLTLERGRARFTVAHDPARPFIVQASGGIVTAHGTVFDVWVRPDRQVRVVLIRGNIDVQAPVRADRATAGGPVQMSPGQRLVFGEDGPLHPMIPAPRPASVSDTQWTDETMDFDDVPLREVLLEVNARSNLPIVLEAPEIADTKIFASFKGRDPMALARKIGLALDLAITRERTQVVLHRHLVER